MGLVASAFHGDPSQRVPVVGVTGTNGKTTVCHLVASIFEASGRPSGVIGTLTGTRTTPEATELQARLAELRSPPARRSRWRSRPTPSSSTGSTAPGSRSPSSRTSARTTSTTTARWRRTSTPRPGSSSRVGPTGRSCASTIRTAACCATPRDIPTVGYRATDASAVEVAPSGTTFTWRGVRMQTSLVGRFNLLERPRGGHDHRRARGRARRHREGPGRRVAGAGPLRARRRRPAVPRRGRLRPHPRRARPSASPRPASWPTAGGSSSCSAAAATGTPPSGRAWARPRRRAPTSSSSPPTTRGSRTPMRSSTRC